MNFGSYTQFCLSWKLTSSRNLKEINSFCNCVCFDETRYHFGRKMIHILEKTYLGSSQARSPKRVKDQRTTKARKNCLEQNIFPRAGHRSSWTPDSLQLFLELNMNMMLEPKETLQVLTLLSLPMSLSNRSKNLNDSIS